MLTDEYDQDDYYDHIKECQGQSDDSSSIRKSRKLLTEREIIETMDQECDKNSQSSMNCYPSRGQ